MTRIVHELHAKIRFLRSHEVPRRICGNHAGTMEAFAERVGISEHTLNDCIKNQKNRIGDATEAKLAQACKFETTWPQWCDVKDGREANGRNVTYDPPRCDTAEAFRIEYLKQNADGEGLQLGQAVPVTAPPFPHLSAERTGPSEAINDRLASVWLSVEQGDVSQMHMELACQAAEIDPSMPRMVIHRGILEVGLGGAELKSLDNARKYLQAHLDRFAKVEGPKAIVSLAGPRDRPSWEFQATDGAIGLQSFEPLCELAALRGGETLSVSFRVYSKELRASDAAPSVAAEDAGPPEPPPLSRADGKPLGAAQEKIMKLLWEKSLPGRQNGSVVLCRDRLLIVKGQIVHN